MKKADNFDASKWLVENKITTQSRLNEDEEKRGFYVTMKPKDGSYGKSTLTNLPNHINQTYSGALQSIERLKAVDGKKGKKYTYYVSDTDGNPLDKDGNIINEESKLNEDLTDQIASLPDFNSAMDREKSELIVGKYAVVRYDESDEGGENMYVVWDNTVNQDEIGSYDDVPEFESTDPAEVANWLKQNA